MAIATRPAIPSDFPTPVLTGREADAFERIWRERWSQTHPGAILCRQLGCPVILPKFIGRSACRTHS